MRSDGKTRSKLDCLSGSAQGRQLQRHSVLSLPIPYANADVVQVLDLETWKAVGVLKVGKEPDGMAHSKRTAKARKSGSH